LDRSTYYNMDSFSSLLQRVNFLKFFHHELFLFNLIDLLELIKQLKAFDYINELTFEMDFENLGSYLLPEYQNIVIHNFIITFGKIVIHFKRYISINSILIIVNILYWSARNFKFYKDLLHLDHFILKFYSYHFFTM
jgi:hypothetical protein